jgi:hypothetical protein
MKTTIPFSEMAANRGHAALALYLLLMALAGRRRSLTVRMGLLRSQLGLGRMAVTRCMKRLAEGGWLAVKRRKKREYTAAFHLRFLVKGKLPSADVRVTDPARKWQFLEAHLRAWGMDAAHELLAGLRRAQFLPPQLRPERGGGPPLLHFRESRAYRLAPERRPPMAVEVGVIALERETADQWYVVGRWSLDDFLKAELSEMLAAIRTDSWVPSPMWTLTSHRSPWRAGEPEEPKPRSAPRASPADAPASMGRVLQHGVGEVTETEL